MYVCMYNVCMQGLLLLMLMIMLTGPDGEPKITHGYTLVSELSLMEVVKTINVSISLSTYVLLSITSCIQEYAFNTSYFPLILSLENHCSKDQQVCNYIW